MGHQERDHKIASERELCRFNTEVYFENASVAMYVEADFAGGELPADVMSLRGEFVLAETKNGWIEAGEGRIINDADGEPCLAVRKTGGETSVSVSNLVSLRVAKPQAPVLPSDFVLTDNARCHPVYDYNYDFVLNHNKNMAAAFGNNWRNKKGIFGFTVDMVAGHPVVPREIKELNTDDVLVYTRYGCAFWGWGNHFEKPDILLTRPVQDENGKWLAHMQTIYESEILAIFIDEGKDYAKTALSEKRKDRFDASIHPSKAIVQHFKEAAAKEGGELMSICLGGDCEEGCLPIEVKNLNGNNVLVFTKFGTVIEGMAFYQCRGIDGLYPCILVGTGEKGAFPISVIPTTDIALIYIEGTKDSPITTRQISDEDLSGIGEEFLNKMDEKFPQWE